LLHFMVMIDMTGKEGSILGFHIGRDRFYIVLGYNFYYEKRV
jgi:hypothetical protein